MAKALLINNTKLKLILCASVAQAELIAESDIPKKDDFKITGVAAGDLEGYSIAELTALHNYCVPKKAHVAKFASLAKGREALAKATGALETDSRTVKELKESGPKRAPGRPVTSGKGSQYQKDDDGNNIYVRPKPNSKTGQVWDIADAMSAKGKNRTEIIEACVKKGINPATAAAQYGRWKAMQGRPEVTARVAAPKPPAKKKAKAKKAPAKKKAAAKKKTSKKK